MSSRARNAETGASLILALAFLSVLGLFGTVLLSYGGISLRATNAVRDQREQVYAADGAVQTAIQHARVDDTIGHDPAAGGSCPDFLVPDLDHQSVTVRCEGQTGSGAVTPNVNAPDNAVLALARGTEPGLVTTGRGTLKVTGAVFSNSAISLGVGGRLDATGAPVTARGSCDTTRVAGSPTRCGIGAKPDPTGDDPGYQPALDTLPVHREVPACPGANATIKLDPGFYDDAKGLSALTGGRCTGATVSLAPGDYYLDFDTDIARSPVWRVADPTVKVIGGCQGPNKPVPAGGVQLEFGGASRLQVDAGAFVACAAPNPKAQRIALFGRPGGGQPTSAFLLPRPQAAATPPGAIAFDSGEAAFAVGEQPTPVISTAVLPPTVPYARAAIDLSSLDPIDPPPGGAGVTGSLVVGHSEEVPAGAAIAPRPGKLTNPRPAPPDPDAPKPPPVPKPPAVPTGAGGGTIGPAPGSAAIPKPSGSIELRATVEPGDGSSPCVWDIPAAVTATTDQAGVTPCVDTPQKRHGLKLSFETISASNVAVTEHLDGVQLLLGYTVPTLRAEAGCVTTPRGCALVSNAPGASVIFDGTVYAPRAAMNLSAGGAEDVLVDRGIVARTITLRDLPSADRDGRIRLGATRTMEFTGLLAGRVTLRALVRFGDSPTVGANAQTIWWRPTS